MRLVIVLHLFIMTIQQSLLFVDGSRCASFVFEKLDMEAKYMTSFKPANPLKLDIGAFTEGRRVFVIGTTPTKTKFHINIVADSHNYALSLKFQSSTYTVVANNKYNGEFGTPVKLEIGSENWPIDVNERFCVEIIAKSDRFEVHFNAEKLLEFKYRKETTDPQKFKQVRTTGDIVVSEVSYTLTN